MSIYDQEIFGPVLSTVRVPDYKQALDLVKSIHMVMVYQFLLEMEIVPGILHLKQI